MQTIETKLNTQAPAVRTAGLRLPSNWTALGWLVALLVIMPIAAVIWLAFNPSENIWPHLISSVLPVYVESTLLLLAGVGALSLFIGVSTAWLVTLCNFPGRRVFEWALLLPFAIPAYVIAYIYTDLLEYAGPVQSGLREFFGWSSARDYSFPEIRSLGGAVLMLSLVLYPYVYLLARSSFLEQSINIRDASRTLGCSAWQSFFRISLPVARPAIAVGLALVAMETLNDFGTVDFFAVKSLSAGIYDAWLNMSNLGAAAQIATLMMLFVVLFIWLERTSRAKAKQFSGADRFKRLERYNLTGGKAVAATLLCLAPVLFGFLVPLAELGSMTLNHLDQFSDSRFLQQASNSFLLSSGAAIFTAILALLLAYSQRLNPNLAGLRFAAKLAHLGYALPGAVLAIGVIIPFAAFDNTLDSWMRDTFDISTGLLLSGTPFAILFAYSVRFLAVSSGSIESSLAKVTPSMDMASRSLGANSFDTLKRVHLPLIRTGLLTALLVVFVDSMKELPATLILRPFNFDTLATAVYQFASDEKLEAAAPGSLLIVLVGIIPVILLSRTITATRDAS
jgi:iron(III) transport system permease protein